MPASRIQPSPAGGVVDILVSFKEKWGDLTDDDLTYIDGKREQLVGRIQERYGLAEEEVESQVSSFERSLELDAANRSDRDVA